MLHRHLGVGLDALRCFGSAEPGYSGELARIRLHELLGRAETQLIEGFGEVLVDALDGGQRGDGLLFDLLELGLADDIELPARQLGCESNVLTSPPDGEREFVIGDDELHGAVGLIDDHAAHLGGCDRVADEPCRVSLVGHDIDLLAPQLLNHGLDARALHAHASADGIDIGVPRIDGDLGSCAWLSGSVHDANDPLVNLRYLLLEALDEQAEVGSRENDQGTASLAVDVLDIGHDAVARAVGFSWDLLAAGEHRLGPTEVDDDVVAALVPSNDAGDQLALTVFIFVIDVLTLGIPNALDDHLFGGLGSDPAETSAVGLELEEVTVLRVLLLGFVRVVFLIEDLEPELLADLGVKTTALTVVDGHLPFGIFHLLGDDHVLVQIDVARLVVEASLQLPPVSEAPFGGMKDRRLHGLYQDFRGYPLIP